MRPSSSQTPRTVLWAEKIDLEALVVGDPRDGAPARKVIPYRAVAIACQRTLFDLAADGVPDQGSAGEGRVAADQLEDKLRRQRIDRADQCYDTDGGEQRRGPERGSDPAKRDQRHERQARQA